jgi:hypothetical protein
MIAEAAYYFFQLAVLAVISQLYWSSIEQFPKL